MLEVNRYVLRFLSVAIVFASVSSYRSVEPSYSIPLNSSGLIALDTNRAEAFFKSGNAKSENKDYKGAISDYTEAIRINPKNATAYFWRGSAKSDLGDKYGAIADYTESIRLNPKNDVTYLKRGLTKWSLGDN